MAFCFERSSIGRIASMAAVRQAAQAGVELVGLWPLTDAMRLDNDAKYAENLQVRVTRDAAAIMTGEDVTMPDSEFVYEGADEIPGRPQKIVDALLAANDAYDAMQRCVDAEDVEERVACAKGAAAEMGVDWEGIDIEGVLEAFSAASNEDEHGDAADRMAWRFALALCACDGLLNMTADGISDARYAALQAVPVVLLVNELRECCAVPRIYMTADQLCGLMEVRSAVEDTLAATAEYVAPLADAEWRRHREDVLWDPDEAKKRAKEEDERKSKEALAAKFAHVKDDPNKPAVEL